MVTGGGVRAEVDGGVWGWDCVRRSLLADCFGRGEVDEEAKNDIRLRAPLRDC
jgi:hypothetical protein